MSNFFITSPETNNFGYYTQIIPHKITNGVLTIDTPNIITSQFTDGDRYSIEDGISYNINTIFEDYNNTYSGFYTTVKFYYRTSEFNDYFFLSSNALQNSIFSSQLQNSSTNKGIAISDNDGINDILKIYSNLTVSINTTTFTTMSITGNIRIVNNNGTDETQDILISLTKKSQYTIEKDFSNVFFFNVPECII